MIGTVHSDNSLQICIRLHPPADKFFLFLQGFRNNHGRLPNSRRISWILAFNSAPACIAAVFSAASSVFSSPKPHASKVFFLENAVSFTKFSFLAEPCLKFILFMEPALLVLFFFTEATFIEVFFAEAFLRNFPFEFPLSVFK